MKSNALLSALRVGFAKHRQNIARHLHKWVASHGRGVQASFMCGVAYRLGDFATGLVIAWLIARY
ncbi:hypothetical protein ACIRP2_37250 [Streptomyces sp. NPDC101194]|uniref:hypothetical protein n=1 Tax=Streptomyces sp. NPDC101194 TaxID=3366127 RepID=UPI003821F601